MRIRLTQDATGRVVTLGAGYALPTGDSIPSTRFDRDLPRARVLRGRVEVACRRDQGRLVSEDIEEVTTTVRFTIEDPETGLSFTDAISVPGNLTDSEMKRARAGIEREKAARFAAWKAAISTPALRRIRSRSWRRSQSRPRRLGPQDRARQTITADPELAARADEDPAIAAVIDRCRHRLARPFRAEGLREAVVATITNANGGNWNAGGTWVGGVAPASGDTVVIDGSLGYPVVNVVSTCAALTVTGAAAKTGSWSLAANLTVSGTLTLRQQRNEPRHRPVEHRRHRPHHHLRRRLARERRFHGHHRCRRGIVDRDLARRLRRQFRHHVRPGADRFAVASGNGSATATWSASSGGAPGASVPLPEDNVYLNAASGAITVTIDMPRFCKNLVCTGYSGRWLSARTPESRVPSTDRSRSPRA